MVNKPIAVNGNKNTHRHTITQIHMNTKAILTSQKIDGALQKFDKFETGVQEVLWKPEYGASERCFQGF